MFFKNNSLHLEEKNRTHTVMCSFVCAGVKCNYVHVGDIKTSMQIWGDILWYYGKIKNKLSLHSIDSPNSEKILALCSVRHGIDGGLDLIGILFAVTFSRKRMALTLSSHQKQHFSNMSALQAVIPSNPLWLFKNLKASSVLTVVISKQAFEFVRMVKFAQCSIWKFVSNLISVGKPPVWTPSAS